jgi:hypothetical protein
MNVNWERRGKCNQCGAPKPGTGDQKREGQVGTVLTVWFFGHGGGGDKLMGGGGGGETN